MKKLSLSLTIFIFFLLFYQFDVIAKEKETYVGVTGGQDTLLYKGASESYDIKQSIPSNSNIIILSELLSENNVTWLNVKYNQQKGWIKEDANINPTNIENYLFTGSSKNVPIRKGASPSYKITSTLQKGELVKVVDTITSTTGEPWVRIEHGKTKGWTPLTELELFNGEENYLNKVLFIKNDSPLKRSATHNDKTIYTIKTGTPVLVYSSFYTSEGTWYRIKDGNKSGWILAKYTTNQMPISTSLHVNVENANVHKGATSIYKIVSTLSYGQQVQASIKFVNSSNEVWYKITYGNHKEGWIRADSLSTENVKLAYLTIDDGPTYLTSRLLDILETYNAKATFFMVNGHINQYSKEVKRMVKEGHSVGSHSVTHDKNKFYKSPQSAVNEMVQNRNTINKVTGIYSNLMRTPYGSVPYMKKNYRTAMTKQKFIMWDWNIDSLDWKFNNSSYVAHTLNQVSRVERNGGTPYILIHDRKATIDHLPMLIKALQARGYTLAPINESMTPHQFSSK